MYRKFSADHIFDGYRMHQQSVLITDESGRVVDFVAAADAGEDIEKQQGVLSPGFVNCHCHLELSHMKGLIPKETGLVDFVLNVVQQRHISEKQILHAIAIADKEMEDNGIVAVGDICNNNLTIGQKQMSRLAYHHFIEAAGFPPEAAIARFKKAVDLYEDFSVKFPPLSVSITAHAPYSVSPQMFAFINDFPANDIISVHNQETAAENEFFEAGTGDLMRMYAQMGIATGFYKHSGTSSLQTWLPRVTHGHSVILVHNVYTNKADVEFAQSYAKTSNLEIFFCLCPNANLYISKALPDVSMLQSTGCQIVLGTDSLASNDQLSILEEMKSLQLHLPELTAETLLQWATSNGANALKMQHDIGSFEKNKKPGVLILQGLEKNKFSSTASVKRIL